MPEWETILNSKRKDILKLMHDYIVEIGDENIYESWLKIILHEPTENHSTLICVDDEWFYECCEEFAKLVKYDK